MDELELIKNYLRIDPDNTDDDIQLSGLIEAARLYISNSTGITYDTHNELHALCTKLLVAHWYSDRSIVGQSSLSEYPHSISALLNHLELSNPGESL